MYTIGSIVVVLYCVLKLCTVISTLGWAVLTVLWIGFCHTGPMSLCVLHICCIIVSTGGGWTWWDWSLILRTYLPSVLWHCWLGHLIHKIPSPIWPIHCNVFGGTLNPAQSINQSISRHHCICWGHHSHCTSSTTITNTIYGPFSRTIQVSQYLTHLHLFWSSIIR